MDPGPGQNRPRQVSGPSVRTETRSRRDRARFGSLNESGGSVGTLWVRVKVLTPLITRTLAGLLRVLGTSLSIDPKGLTKTLTKDLTKFNCSDK